MEKSVIIHSEQIMEKFHETLIEYVKAEGELPDTISIVAKGDKKILGTVRVEKKVFEHPGSVKK